MAKCLDCGRETGANWKKQCLDCYKKAKRNMQNRNYLEAWRSGNIQNDLSFAEDNNY